jgi:alpha-glucosidase
MTVSEAALAWWQRGVIYQIWVRSFFDSDGDGNGDLAGLIARLDYLKWLGVDVLWLSPIYPSPLIESGYDVEDYTGVHQRFGTLEQFDQLLAQAHERGMRVILDFVPSHTSDLHPWFVEARLGRDSPKRNWYLWADPAQAGAPPNNWVSTFDGSAWTYDAATKQYYEHAFLPQQPDLNWRHPETKQAVYDAMRFWLRRGVDGFRMDAIWHLIKDAQLRDNPPNPDYSPDTAPDNVVLSTYTRDRPEVHAVCAEMRQVVDEFEDRLLSGELYLDVKRMMTYYGPPSQPELHLPFNLQLSVMPWDAQALGSYIEEYLRELPQGAWPNWSLSTHDSQRVATRAGARGARLAALLLLTLPGTPTIYYGDEIGMANVDIPRAQITDQRELRTPYRGLGRDPARTPMRWDASPHAGFTTGMPWLPVGDDVEAINVAAERDDPASMLSLYRRLLALRQATPAILERGFRRLEAGEHLLLYERPAGDQRLVVALNFDQRQASVTLAKAGVAGRVLLSTHADRDDEAVTQRITLRPQEGMVLRFSTTES